MSATKKQASERLRAKKMSKVQMQQAIIKKKQCDAKALAIVEQLLEPIVNPDWLLQNLKFISKSHMEDVIEERSIVKLCGYVLCSKSLTVIVRQQYHISTRNNKVYDISKRKKFCSAFCYGAANFLLEQMLESPLWLREKDDIPVFKILPINSKHVLGDEIDVAGIKLAQNIEAANAECAERSKKDDFEKECSKECLEAEQMRKDSLSGASNLKKDSVYNSNLLNVETNTINNISVTNIDLQNLFSSKTCLSKLQTNKENEDYESVKLTTCKSNCDDKIQEVNIKVDNLDVEITKQSNENMSYLCEDNTRNTENKNTNVNTIYKTDDCDIDRTQLNEMSGIQTKINENGFNGCEKVQCHLNKSNNSEKSITQIQLVEIDDNQNGHSDKMQFYSDKLCNDQNDNNEQLESQSNKNTENNDNRKVIQSYSIEECTSDVITSKSSYKPEGKKQNKSNKNKYKQKESDNTDANICYVLVMRVEKNVREWVTENTVCLLLGEEDVKCKLLESLVQRDRYQQLYKKLNRLQLEDEREDRVILEKNMLKPLPHFSVLQEEGKKMELKVRAFYEGRTTISEESTNESGSNDDEPILPLTASHTPNAIRRRIFLDKLNKILPDLLRALTSNTNSCSVAEFTHNNEKYSLVKILISTFNLSAANIVFRTAEWTLVGLLIIKMLSLIDAQIKSLLQTKQATLYTSMILMSYKLDSNYLDRFIMEVTNSQ